MPFIQAIAGNRANLSKHLNTVERMPFIWMLQQAARTVAAWPCRISGTSELTVENSAVIATVRHCAVHVLFERES
jgi:hypothetical protein